MGRSWLRKRTLKNRGHRCILSGFVNVHELETAHIVPRSITRTLRSLDSNVFILSSGLHALFDKFRWTFDLFEFVDTIQPNDKYFQCHVITVDDPSNSSLAEIINIKHTIPIDHLPYLFLHYCVYLKVNYTLDADIPTLYQKYMITPIYLNLLTIKSTLQAQKLIQSHRNMYYDVIVAHKSNLYLVAWSLHPKSAWTWEPANNIQGSGFTEYHDFIK
jgi:hypothetical protein